MGVDLVPETSQFPGKNKRDAREDEEIISQSFMIHDTYMLPKKTYS
jgi:hypothetical protein